MEHPTVATLTAGLDQVRRSPTECGRVDLIVERPAENARDALVEATLDPDEGLVGDTWRVRPSGMTADGSPHPDLQLTVMNARVAALVAGQADRRQLAGDQTNLPPGTRLPLGTAVIEVTDKPHRGCKKLAERFGQDALRFVDSRAGRELRLRGMNAKVVVSGVVCVGDAVRRLPA